MSVLFKPELIKTNQNRLSMRYKYNKARFLLIVNQDYFNTSATFKKMLNTKISESLSCKGERNKKFAGCEIAK